MGQQQRGGSGLSGFGMAARKASLTKIDAPDLERRMKPLPPASSGSPENNAEWRGAFENSELNALHAECFGHPLSSNDWWSQVNHFSLGWVTIRRSEKLIGFVNIVWDGRLHAFILDTIVSLAFQRNGIASTLIAEAANGAKLAGCEWLHVDFDPHLRPFYFDACGFEPTDAGLISLK